MKFAKIEDQFRQLKAQFDAGELSEANFKARLQDLMVQDEGGRWWMIGYETGQWYVHDGEKWVQRDPAPVVEAEVQVIKTPQVAAPAAPPAAPARKRWVWAAAGIVGLIGLILVIVLLRSCNTGPSSGPDPGAGARFWADRDVIRPGECIVVHWEVPGAERVRIAGPGFDLEERPSVGDKQVCPEGTTAYRLLSPDEKVLAAIEIQVRE